MCFGLIQVQCIRSYSFNQRTLLMMDEKTELILWITACQMLLSSATTRQVNAFAHMAHMSLINASQIEVLVVYEDCL